MSRPPPFAAAATAPGFYIPPSQSSSVATQPPAPPPVRKSKTRRKRHVPPGPAGAWFQARSHQQQQDGKTNDDDDPSSLINNKQNNNGDENEQPVTDVTTSTAWMLMQLQQPQWLTPYLPPYATIAQRHEVLRQLFPSSTHCFLPEIHKGQYDLSTKGSSPTADDGVQLLVLVHAVHSHSHCDWTVELRDETGATIQAWIAPSLVMQERDQPDKVHAGVVWCLQNVAILPDGNSSHRWLLIHEAAITKYWVAPKEVAHAVYLQWMEKRNALPNSSSTGALAQQLRMGNQNGEEEEEEEMEVEPVELPVRTLPRAEPNPTVLPMEDLDILPADFGMHILSSLHPPTAPSQQATPTTATALEPIAAPVLPIIAAVTPHQNRNEGGERPPLISAQRANPQQQSQSTPQHDRFAAFSATQQTVIPTPSPPANQVSVARQTPKQPMRANPYAASKKRQHQQQPTTSTTNNATSVGNETPRQSHDSRTSEQPASTETAAKPTVSCKRPLPPETNKMSQIQPSNHQVLSQQPPSSKKQASNASFLQKFAATTSTPKADVSTSQIDAMSKDTNKPCEDDEESDNVPKKKKNKKKKQLSSSTKSPTLSPKKGVDTPISSSPKAMLWSSGATASMMGMLDDDDDDDDEAQPIAGAAVANTLKASPPASTKGESTLFQASNFAGMMGMFDDDDDDD